MKIGHLEPQALPASPATERKSPAPVPAAEAVNSGTKVDLSASAALRAAVSSEPTFDAAKVERIKQAIQDGSFKVNPGVIADKLIANAQELLGRSST